MRTTITLANDVAASLRRLQTERGGSFEELVNQVLREGLRQVEKPSVHGLYRTGARHLGPCLVGSIDNVAETLAAADGEDYR